MAESLSLNLEGSPVDPDGDEPGFWVDGAVVTIRTDAFTEVVRLPKQAKRITILRLGSGRARLGIGGYTRSTVSVTGPVEIIERLRAEVL